jgi:ketosteroid isomerase-like protein
MSIDNKTILQTANACITAGDNEGFLAYCTDEVTWHFIGDQTLTGKQAIRQYMAETYTEPPKFDVEHLIAEGDFVTAVGKISLKDKNAKLVNYAYCDVWRFENCKMAELKAFVVEE